jgi:protein-disulfide isomerase
LNFQRRVSFPAGSRTRRGRIGPATLRALLVLFIPAFANIPPAWAQTPSANLKPAVSMAPSRHATAKAGAARPVAETAGPPMKSYGSKNAPIVMEVFTDYECPSCRSLYEQTLRPMIGDYVASGKVYLVHRDFPLPMHKYGYEAARWLNAAARVGEFANVEAALYDNQAAWSNDGSIEKYVAAAMPASDFKRVQKLMEGCQNQTAAANGKAQLKNVAQASHACALDPYINADRSLGLQIPVQATPTYVITYKGQRFPAGSGIVTWPILKQFFDSLLSQ